MQTEQFTFIQVSLKGVCCAVEGLNERSMLQEDKWLFIYYIDTALIYYICFLFFSWEHPLL